VVPTDSVTIPRRPNVEKIRRSESGDRVTYFADRLIEGALYGLPKRRISRALGWLGARRLSEAAMRRAITLYVRAFGVDLSEAVVPSGGYRTFDAFFTRSLREGARPLNGAPDCLVVPADGLVLDTGRADRSSRLAIKGSHYMLGELLGNANAQGLAGGRFAVIYLAPGDYHRVHTPVSGRVRAVHHVGGTLFPVNAIGLAAAPRLFVRNERVVVFQESEVLGSVVTVLVGAFGVGRIGVSFDPTIMTNVGRAPITKHYPPEDAPYVQQGDELGVFHLGSTVIVVSNPRIPLALTVSPGDRVRVGQVLAKPDRSK